MKLVRIWMVFVGIWMMVGGFIHLPFAYDITAIPGWKSDINSVESLSVYYSNTYLGVTFLLIGITLFFAYKDPLKNSLFILFNIVMHAFVYIFNMLSVQLGLGESIVAIVAQGELLIVIIGIAAYTRMLRTAKVAAKNA